MPARSIEAHCPSPVAERLTTESVRNVNRHFLAGASGMSAMTEAGYRIRDGLNVWIGPVIRFENIHPSPCLEALYE